MSNGYEATEAFLSGIEQELKHEGSSTQPSSDRGGRDYDRRDRDRDRGDTRRRHYHDDEDRSRRRRGFEEEEEEDVARKSSRRDHGQDRRSSDYRRRDEYHRERDSRSGGRRDAYGYDYRGGGGYRADDRYDDYHYNSSRRRDDRRNDGSGGWRSGPVGEASAVIQRSPTPPGTQPISERVRKNSKWNIAAPGFESTSAMQAKATGMFGIPGQSRTLGVPGQGNPAGHSGPPAAMMTPAGMSNAGGAANASSQQNNRQSRRLYVGNINVDTIDVQLCAFFNDQMRKMNFTLEEGDPVIAAQVNPDKGYAFVEFRSAGEATNAMSFDGIVFQGQSMKIRRPKDYVGPDVHPPTALHVPGVISTNVPDGPNKIYIGGLPMYLNEEQVIELLKAFGDLRSFNLVRESGVNGASKGFAFCEYVDVAITDLAIQSLNEMELGDRRLLVQRASVGTSNQQRNAGTAGSPPITGANSVTAGAANGSNSLMPPVADAGANGPGEPTKAMMLLNCVTAEELVDAEDYQDIVEDMREECSKYGTVVDMRIPRPEAASKGTAAQSWKQSVAEKEETKKEREGVGRVYVMFNEAESCRKALEAIAGRQFAGRTVIAAFIAEDAFPADEDGGRDAAETSMQAMT